MLPVQVLGPKGIVNIVAFMDDGSNVTLLDSTVAEKIGATGQRVLLCCNVTDQLASVDMRKYPLKKSKNFDEQHNGKSRLACPEI
jgi:hypothetical protein